MQAARKPGRPPKGLKPMTPAERVKASRERATEAALTANDHLPSATTKALLSNLARQIKFIETDPSHAPVARDIAKDVISELCKRYEIK